MAAPGNHPQMPGPSTRCGCSPRSAASRRSTRRQSSTRTSPTPRGRERASAARRSRYVSARSIVEDAYVRSQLCIRSAGSRLARMPTSARRRGPPGGGEHCSKAGIALTAGVAAKLRSRPEGGTPPPRALSPLVPNAIAARPQRYRRSSPTLSPLVSRAVAGRRRRTARWSRAVPGVWPAVRR